MKEDDFPKVPIDKILNVITVPPPEKLTWRDRFAMGIVKKVRLYITQGREAALLLNLDK